ncbi:phosphoribosylpyrophosphate synthetase [Aquimarina sp. U1-2]|uniref:phosphoribosylpyrophosphate synthetase n=1 Tax=Aquimarina sp. U1-2 TaxID=2823141 RepID=UPI001AED08A0|nr:phosphoribosylpyrophosphate synthetase [Aquimarina sp. U1-2]MBP2833094.1 phosphoribosylpyrophosphate synthetase [Aquimarina sp. U1-2]
MNAYDNLVEAINDLKSKGFTQDFNLQQDKIYCPVLKMYYRPKEFKVMEKHRFEGMSSVDDNSVLYAISTKSGVKGLLVDSYGVYSEVSKELLDKLK